MRVYIFLLNSKSIGGIETVARNLLSIFQKYSNSVDVQIVDLLEIKVQLGCISTAELEACYRLIKQAKDGDVILSLYDRLTIQLLFSNLILRKKIRIIGCQHADYYANRIHTRILRRIIYNNAEKIVALTSTDSHHYKSVGIHNVEVIPNPLIFYPEHVPLFSERKNIVVAAGRLNKVKGFHYTLELASRMQEYKNISFNIFGDGEERDALSSYAERLGIRPQDIFMGATSKLDYFLSKAKFLVVTSYRESFSMVILEAMAAGCIPISFDCPTGPRELIDDGVNGYLVPSGDIMKIKNIIEYLIDNPIAAECIAANAREKAKSFTGPDIICLWREVINEL
ncbi:glycosyltransferase [Aeromonas hydrophila]|uniref:glycosyltransferase n=1 Tax=Aeromonas hydrophila TaxID=644 RepID=UPI0009BC147F|nr:glycosyltransferase [Aeromonas hydrophila]ELM3749665.1 glycosyltransferase [Aeromonas dhakensis]QGZ72378.1 glycosyltransferase [Aeromonas hydrophila]HEB5079635.1 glycosyltransferase [Aeromonas hydrophila subsp. hydrophila]